MERALAQLSRLGILTETAEARALLMGVSRAVGADGEEASDIIASMEEGLKAISTLPVRTVLEPLRRSLRDLCKRSGKEAQLSVSGAELSLDRRVLEALQGALAHLLRNAIDHGIETPEERAARGKQREGALSVRVEQQGNTIFLEMSDDGRGLDAEQIREVALRKAIAPAEELSAMGTGQLHQLIFRPGFTTRDEVSEISGRGVGLDAVRNQVQALQGNVEVQSEPGRGARFILTMPAEMGSSPVVVVRCGEHRLGVPMVAVESSRMARAKDLQVGRTRVQLLHRDELVPVRDLGALLGFRQPEAPAEGRCWCSSGRTASSPSASMKWRATASWSSGRCRSSCATCPPIRARPPSPAASWCPSSGPTGSSTSNGAAMQSSAARAARWWSMTRSPPARSTAPPSNPAAIWCIPPATRGRRWNSCDTPRTT